MKVSHLFLLPATLLLSGCSDDDPILNDEYRVSGTITDSISHQSLAGVQVKLLEDREPFVSGGNVLHLLTTDKSGTYSMDFKWKDSPYEVYISKPGYRYQRIITDHLLHDTLVVDYKGVEFGRHDSRLDFAMELTDHVILNLKNQEPKNPDDQLILRVRKTRNGPVYMGPLYDIGIQDHDYYLGLLTPGTYVYLEYSKKQQGITTQHSDSLLIQPNTVLMHEIAY